MITVYDGEAKGRAWALRLKQAGGNAVLVAVDAVSGDERAGLASITPRGITPTSSARNALECCGYDTSNTRWTAYGAIAIHGKGE